jgi:hypothetical protein
VLLTLGALLDPTFTCASGSLIASLELGLEA